MFWQLGTGKEVMLYVLIRFNRKMVHLSIMLTVIVIIKFSFYVNKFC